MYAFSLTFLVHNPYDEQVYLCIAIPKTILLMQWYGPLEKFMKVQVRTMDYHKLKRMALHPLCLLFVSQNGAAKLQRGKSFLRIMCTKTLHGNGISFVVYLCIILVTS